jgi:hypothetical protein
MWLYMNGCETIFFLWLKEVMNYPINLALKSLLKINTILIPTKVEWSRSILIVFAKSWESIKI